MKADEVFGTLNKRIEQGGVTDETIKKIVEQYFEEHPVQITTDNTLSIAGAPADAKVAGDKLSGLEEKTNSLKEDLDDLSDTLIDVSENYTEYIEAEPTVRDGRINVGRPNQVLYPDGSILNDGTDTLYVIKKYNLPMNSRVKIDFSTVQDKVANYAFYDVNGNMISIFPTEAINGESVITNTFVDAPINANYILVCTRKTQEANLHLYVSTKNKIATLDISMIQRTADFMTDNESYSVENVHEVDANGKKNVVKVINRVKYPNNVVFGGEYLEHWYEKIYDGTQSVVVDIEGDSISQGYSGQNVFLGMRDYAIKRIMKGGGYDLSRVSIYNNAIGGCSTNEWVGRTEYFKESFRTEEYYTRYANGMLAYGMEQNPDLMIIGFGMNDAEIDVNNLSLKERLDLFEANFREAMERLRGNAPINGRPAYGKSVDDLSIIVTNVTNTVADQYRYYENWQIYVRDLLAKLCREYKCAYADFTKLTYGYTDTEFTSWRQIKENGQKVGLHPNKYQVAYWMSALAGLIYPVCMHNIDVN